MNRRRTGILVVVGVIALCLPTSARVHAQDVEAAESTAARARLKGRIEETWRVVPLTGGVLLVPRRASIRVKGIELSGAAVAIDGKPTTGPEVVERLGADAEPVLQLSYLPSADRLALFVDPAPEPVERDVRQSPESPSQPEIDPWPVNRGARVRVFGNITIPEGERVGDVVAVFGSIDLQGSADGNVVAVLGDVSLGPKSTSRGDVVAVGGAVRPMDAARIMGKVTEFRVDLPNVQVTVPGDDRFSIQMSPDWPRIARLQWVGGLVAALMVLAICCLVVLVAPGRVEAVRQQDRSMLVCAMAGLAVQVLTLPALVLIASALALSVVGIPLLALIPLLLLAVLALAFVGFTGVAARVGSVPLVSPPGASVAAVLLGLLIIWAPGLVGRLLWAESGGYSAWGVGLTVAGAVLEYVCWTIGLGAALLTWLARGRRREASVPLAPPPPIAVEY
jgi:hypothetical protein